MEFFASASYYHVSSIVLSIYIFIVAGFRCVMKHHPENSFPFWFASNLLVLCQFLLTSFHFCLFSLYFSCL